MHTDTWIYRRLGLLVETTFVIGIDEDALIDLLDRICLSWNSQRGFFETDLTRLSRAVARKDEMAFVFSVYSCGRQGSIIMTLFAEHRKDLSSSTIWIQASFVLPQVWGASHASLKEFELRMKNLFDSLDGYIEEGTESFKEDFECPRCKARYSSKVLQHKDDKVQCQNCGKWISMI